MTPRLSRSLPWLLAALAATGLGISVYLTVAHWAKRTIVCGGFGQCDYVNSSDYAHIGDIPVSLLGVAMYVGLLAAAVIWALRPGDDLRRVAYWGLALAGAGYAAYLTYVELAVLYAVCVWCIASATILALSLAMSTVSLLRQDET